MKLNKIIDFLEEGDALVLNDTKVLPARLIGIKEDTNAVIEILLLNAFKASPFSGVLTKAAEPFSLNISA